MKVTDEPSKIQTTLRLPRELYDSANRLVQEEGKISSLNDLVVRAVRAYVAMLRRRQIDSQFAAMALDSAYQKQAQQIAEEFSASDWEALEMAEREMDGVDDAAR